MTITNMEPIRTANGQMKVVGRLSYPRISDNSLNTC